MDNLINVGIVMTLCITIPFMLTVIIALLADIIEKGEK